AALMIGAFTEPTENEHCAVDRFIGVEDRRGVLGAVDALDLGHSPLRADIVVGGGDAAEDAGAVEQIPHRPALAIGNRIDERQAFLRGLERVEALDEPSESAPFIAKMGGSLEALGLRGRLHLRLDALEQAAIAAVEESADGAGLLMIGRTRDF